MPQRKYGGLIWTNHALNRLIERGLSQEKAWETFRDPDIKQKAKTDGFVFQKRFGEALVTVIAKENEKKEWIVISSWMDPPAPGSPDALQKSHYKMYRKASGFGKFLLTVKSQLGF